MANKSFPIKMLQVSIVCLFLHIIVMATGGSTSTSWVQVATRPENAFRPLTTDSCAERQTPGLICHSCSVVATCVRINNEWRTVPVAECDNTTGMFCNIRQGGCSNMAGPCNSIGHQQNFVCTSIGVFPDPYDCQKYHFCQQSGNSLGAINVECGGSNAFNPATGQCSLNLNDDVCRVDQYQCDHVGYQAQWPGNSNIFYICKAEMVNNVTILYPALYRCAPEEIFNGTYCVHSDTSSNSTNPSTTDNPNGGLECPEFGLYPIEGDCRSYYFCDNDLIPTVYKCPEGSYFDVELHGCTRGECIDGVVN